MKHEDVRNLLNDWIDGELGPDRDREIRAHLAACSACSAEAAELREIIERAERLPAEIEPERDLWPGIEEKLESHGAFESGRDETSQYGTYRPADRSPGELLRSILNPFRQRRRFALPALGFTAALAILVFIMVRSPYSPGPSRSTETSVASKPSRSEQATLDVLRGLEAECIQAEQEFALASSRSPAGSSSRVLQSMTRDMLTIDRAIVEISDAWAGNPEDGSLTEQLISAYQKRIRLQEQMIQVTVRT
jgi:hypothetical protein